MTCNKYILGLPNGSGIYKITNTATGKFYIGSAVNLFRRINSHMQRFRDGTHHNVHMLSAFKKYGEDSFVFSVVEYVDEKSQLIDREQHWIDQTKAVELGYNKAPKAGSSYGCKASDETKKKMSDARLGKPHILTPEGMERLLESRRNFKMSEDSKKKISDTKKSKPPTDAQIKARERNKYAMLGRRHKPETIEKLREINTGRKHKQETKDKLREIKTGIPRSKEAIEASAAWHRGRKDSPDVVAKRAASNTGKTRTPEQRARMSAARRAGIEKRKQESERLALVSEKQMELTF